MCYHSKLITIKHYHSLLDRFLENWLKKKQLLYMYNVFLLIPWVVKLFINDYIKCNAVKILRDKRHWYLIKVSLLFGRERRYKMLENVLLLPHTIIIKQRIKVEYLHKWSCKGQLFIRYSSCVNVCTLLYLFT